MVVFVKFWSRARERRKGEVESFFQARGETLLPAHNLFVMIQKLLSFVVVDMWWFGE